jgi:hypothetical protein
VVLPRIRAQPSPATSAKTTATSALNLSIAPVRGQAFSRGGIRFHGEDWREAACDNRIPLWVTYVVLVVGMLIGSLYVPQASIFLPGPSVSEPGNEIINLLGEMIQLVSGLNTAVLGAAAAMTVKGREWSSRWNRSDSLLTIAVFAFCSVSYFGGYLCYVRLLSMLAANGGGAVNPIETEMLWPIRFQYWGVDSRCSCAGPGFLEDA